MSELATLSLARSEDAEEIAGMSRDTIEEGLTWSWTPTRVRRSILSRESSVVVARRDGTARICELNAKPLRAVDDWLRDYEMFWSQSLRNLKRLVEEDP